jgi:hypothetical protein
MYGFPPPPRARTAHRGKTSEGFVAGNTGEAELHAFRAMACAPAATHSRSGLTPTTSPWRQQAFSPAGILWNSASRSTRKPVNGKKNFLRAHSGNRSFMRDARSDEHYWPDRVKVRSERPDLREK